jgi:arabinosyltransferase C
VLVEPQATPLASVLGGEVGELVARMHRAEGVDLRCGIAGDIGSALAGSDTAGFSPNGVAPVLTSDEVESTTGRANSVSDDQDELRDAAKSAGSESDTSRGSGINASNVALPFGLDPATTPVLGSYREGSQTPASLTTGWYQLPDLVDGSRGDIVAIAVAGRIRSIDSDGIAHPGQNLALEYGRGRPDGSITSTGRVLPIDIGPSPMWRNLRVPLDQLPEEADVVASWPTTRTSTKTSGSP